MLSGFCGIAQIDFLLDYQRTHTHKEDSKYGGKDKGCKVKRPKAIDNII